MITFICIIGLIVGLITCPKEDRVTIRGSGPAIHYIITLDDLKEEQPAALPTNEPNDTNSR